MKIGVLGSGIVGQTLGAGFAKVGHQVMMGTRDPSTEKVRDWVSKTGPGVSAGTFAEAARFGEVIVLATLWSGTESAIRLADPQSVKGKVVLDATNPLVYQKNAPPGLALGYTDSSGEQVQRWLPGARTVKAFNTVGNAHMVNPQFPDGTPDLYICGNDDAAKETVKKLAGELGWSSIVDIGGIEGSRLLDPMAIFWVVYGFRSGGWNHAFKMLRK